MKANIDKDGLLMIHAESGIEKYALQNWCEANIVKDKVNLDKLEIYWGDVENYIHE